MKYICLLRGINVGGNNRVSMADLKRCFESLGFTNVLTYINSGNVLFETSEENDAVLVERCKKAIEREFGFSVPVAVISAEELESALKDAPKWWNENPADKNNAIFVIAPASAKDIMKEVAQTQFTDHDFYQKYVRQIEEALKKDRIAMDVITKYYQRMSGGDTVTIN